MKLRGLGFVKQVFNPGMKEKGRDKQSGKLEEKEVMSEGIGESEMEKLVPE